MKNTVLILVAMFALGSVNQAVAQDANFPSRKAIILNISPHVQLTDFSFGNTYSDRRTKFQQSITWKNGQSSLIAFEIVILKYDAFDQRLIGTRWTVTGKNSADWRPLEPNEVSSDATIGIVGEEVFTAIAYVRSVRLADGTVWRSNEVDVVNNLRKVAPGIKDFGSVTPDQK